MAIFGVGSSKQDWSQISIDLATTTAAIKCMINNQLEAMVTVAAVEAASVEGKINISNQLVETTTSNRHWSWMTVSA